MLKTFKQNIKTIKTSLQSKLKGFTLLELIVVIAIISILAVISFPSFQSALRRARDAKRVTELGNLQTDLLIYSQTQSNGQYYPSSTWNDGGIGLTVCQDGTNQNKQNCALTMLYKKLAKTVPKGVINGEYKYVGMRCDPTKTAANGAQGCQSFQLWTNLEDGNSSLDDDSDVNTTQTGTNGNVCTVDATYSVCSGQIVDASNRTVSEACTSHSITASDCVFDLSPQ